jgi:Tfp pilus assembly protein PilN
LGGLVAGARHRFVLTVLIAVLAGVALYLGKRLLDARAEAAQLRTQVAFLKRRLSKAGH